MRPHAVPVERRLSMYSHFSLLNDHKRLQQKNLKIVFFLAPALDRGNVDKLGLWLGNRLLNGNGYTGGMFIGPIWGGITAFCFWLFDKFCD